MMNQYGYWILGAGLMLEVLALPLPGEFLMSYAGLLIYQGHMNWLLSMAAAWLGCCAGVTAAYGIGYAAGVPFFEKVGPKIHLGPDKLAKMSAWFDRYGNKLLLVAYYIPGVRHFTGYFAGVTRLPFRTFAIYAYTGAFLWTGMFITLGKLLGPGWEKYHHTIQKYLSLAGSLAVFALVIVYVIRTKKMYWKEAVLHWIDKGYGRFRSTGKVGLLVGGAFLLLLAATGWTISIVQDLLARDFSEFDELAPFLIRSAFDQPWAPSVMEILQHLSDPVILVPAAILGIFPVIRHRQDRWIELGYYAFGMVGGWLWEIGLRHLFHRTGPDLSSYTFPSEPVIMAVIVAGLTAYFTGRSIRRRRLHIFLTVCAVIVCLLNGIACIYSGDYYPTDVTAAYALGGVWISSLIVVLEIFRLMRKKRDV
jgi:membrane protein DedA with SNARE-associated domain